jgi:RimJ/RimL family protein N-acetyltransferase
VVPCSWQNQLQSGPFYLAADTRFFRSPTDPGSAEIALTVADWWQGRGLGSELLRHLVDCAREEKITRFTADLLTDNRAMLALIRQIGVVDTTVDGVTMTATVTSDEYRRQLSERG